MLLHRRSARLEGLCHMNTNQITPTQMVDVFARELGLALANNRRDSAKQCNEIHKLIEYHLKPLAQQLEAAEKELPLVLGHPATKDWCEAVDSHHAATEEEVNRLRSTIATQSAEIERLHKLIDERDVHSAKLQNEASKLMDKEQTK